MRILQGTALRHNRYFNFSMVRHCIKLSLPYIMCALPCLKCVLTGITYMTGIM